MDKVGLGGGALDSFTGALGETVHFAPWDQFFDQGPRGTAQNDKSLKSFISGAAPQNPLALPLETPWRCPSKPLRRPSKPHGAVPRNPRCAAPQNPWGQILRPKFSSFSGF